MSYLLGENVPFPNLTAPLIITQRQPLSLLAITRSIKVLFFNHIPLSTRPGGGVFMIRLCSIRGFEVQIDGEGLSREPQWRFYRTINFCNWSRYELYKKLIVTNLTIASETTSASIIPTKFPFDCTWLEKFVPRRVCYVTYSRAALIWCKLPRNPPQWQTALLAHLFTSEPIPYLAFVILGVVEASLLHKPYVKRASVVDSTMCRVTQHSTHRWSWIISKWLQ